MLAPGGTATVSGGSQTGTLTEPPGASTWTFVEVHNASAYPVDLYRGTRYMGLLAAYNINVYALLAAGDTASNLPLTYVSRAPSAAPPSGGDETIYTVWGQYGDRVNGRFPAPLAAQAVAASGVSGNVDVTNSSRAAGVIPGARSTAFGVTVTGTGGTIASGPTVVAVVALANGSSAAQTFTLNDFDSGHSLRFVLAAGASLTVDLDHQLVSGNTLSVNISPGDAAASASASRAS